MNRTANRALSAARFFLPLVLFTPFLHGQCSVNGVSVPCPTNPSGVTINGTFIPLGGSGTVSGGGGSSLPSGTGIVKTANGTASLAVAGTDYDAAGAGSTAAAAIVNQTNTFPLRQEFGDVTNATDEILNIGYNGRCIGFNRNTDTGAIYNSAGEAFQLCHTLGASAVDLLTFQAYNGGGGVNAFSMDSFGNSFFGGSAQSKFDGSGNLTVPTLNGITAATLSRVDPTSSIQTQLNSKVGTATANVFTAEQTFTGTASAAAFNMVGTTADPTTVNNGDLWFNTTLARLTFRAGGVTRPITYTNDPAVNFTGGNINGVAIGATTASTGRFTTIHETLTTPTSSAATCSAGDFTDDANYHYVCTAANTWKRAALSTF